MANDSEDLKGIRQDIKDLDSKQDHQTEILTNLRVDIAKTEATISGHIEQEKQTLTRIENIDNKLGEYNSLLAVHIEGVNQLRRTNELLEKKMDVHAQEADVRLQVLEAPRKWIIGTKTVLLGTSKIVVAIMAIAGFAKWLGLF